MPKLKVFRTPIGFHDAYVATLSRAAALRAWGSDKNLFARGMAEEVTDPALTAEPLAQPGTVFKRSRGTAGEQVAALSKGKTSAARKSKPKPAKAVKPRGPRPDRAPLDAAEKALVDAADQHERDVGELDRQIAALEKKRATLDTQYCTKAAKLEGQRASREIAYDRAMAKWRGS
ncbi:MAG: hypothetical protein E7773_06610 [Sphingomonas sp.]|uniref:hypothetical protein n=1 Tax=Sphingomonas sp. TaxID=28214 RepID=UPI0012016839|nr:hypothetical protein [Sphingomonas sp.]THD36672.1 MAG: hypothetical protein E7773_06610 [Sphingomonas sp.]